MGVTIYSWGRLQVGEHLCRHLLGQGAEDHHNFFPGQQFEELGHVHLLQGFQFFFQGDVIPLFRHLDEAGKIQFIVFHLGYLPSAF